MFTSDGIYSGSYGNDTSEGHVVRPLEGKNGTDRGTKGRQFEDCGEELGFPRKTLERAVTQLHKEFIDDCRTEFEITRKQTLAPAGNRRQLSKPRLTSTPVPRFSGKSNWEQYREIFEAIVCSNGWDEITAALQLLSHLDGDALKVALLVPESQRTVPASFSSGRRCTQGRTAGSGVPADRARVSNQFLVGPLQLPRTQSGVQASISAGGPTARR